MKWKTKKWWIFGGISLFLLSIPFVLISVWIQSKGNSSLIVNTENEIKKDKLFEINNYFLNEESKFLSYDEARLPLIKKDENIETVLNDIIVNCQNAINSFESYAKNEKFDNNK